MVDTTAPPFFGTNYLKIVWANFCSSHKGLSEIFKYFLHSCVSGTRFILYVYGHCGSCGRWFLLASIFEALRMNATAVLRMGSGDMSGHFGGFCTDFGEDNWGGGGVLVELYGRTSPRLVGAAPSSNLFT